MTTDTMNSDLTEDAGRPLAVAIDTGGTFTDVVLIDRASGRTWRAKTPSTPRDRSQAFADGIGAVLGLAAGQAATVGHVFHGTTVATNAILEAKGAVAGLLTTGGFRHVLEIGRHDIPRHENLYAWVKPARPVPPERVLEVAERIGPDGAVLAPLDEEGVRAAAAAFKRLGVAAIAVCFINGYANPVHEQRAAKILAELLPDIPVTTSSEVLPVFREYERGMATVLNAYVMPAVSSYVDRLRARLRDAALDHARLLLMTSSGGVIGPDDAARTPVRTALSGPAAGVVGAREAGLRAGLDRLITLDVGGTSADICLIDGGEPKLNREGTVGDWPLSLPMIDIHTIGAGGGSIARVSPQGDLSVGPASAGADPGPVAYGRGGEEPTLTDANLVLGHLPAALVGGAMSLDVDAAARAIEDKVARPLGMDLYRAARGIVAVADNLMVGAIRLVSVQRGHDPKDFALLPFGGAGPLQAGAIARLLGTPRILVPAHPGVLSAEGLLASRLRSSFTRTCLQRPPKVDLVELASVFGDLDGQAAGWLAEAGVPARGRQVLWRAGMRYLHQGFELFVDWPGRTVEAGAVERAIAAFHEAHDRLYTFSQPDVPVEIVTLEVTALGALPAVSVAAQAASAPGESVVARQTVHLPDGPVPVPVHDRTLLAPGATVTGPAIVTQMDATTWLHPGDSAVVHASGALIVTVGG